MDQWKDKIVNILQHKRLKEPQAFREYLPEVDYLLACHFKPSAEMSKTSTVPDRPLKDYESAWLDVVHKLEEWTKTKTAAVDALERCANLLFHDRRTYLADRETVQGLFCKVTGKPPESYDYDTTVPMRDGGPVKHHLSVIRGVYFQLDSECRLVSIAIEPIKVAEGRSMLDMIKPRPDIATDVSARHDDYLGTQDPHGRW